MIELKDEDLLLRLRNYEDHFVERKTSGDHKDWLKTVVGFANSAPIGYPAVLYIGVKESGEVESGVNLETLQKTLGKKLASAYPRIYYMTRVLAEHGIQFLAVVVPGSENRPHFAGPSYVRVGPETVKASDAEFQRLIDTRSSPVWQLNQWAGKQITLEIVTTYGNLSRRQETTEAEIRFVNQFFVTLAYRGNCWSYPLKQLTISWDDRNKRLKVILEQLSVAR
jgi:predicted HTH transcriptional regulator